MNTTPLSVVIATAVSCVLAGCSQVPTIDSEGYLTNTIGMKFKLIESGTFMMGYDGPDALEMERNVHQVTITKPFLIGVYEVTQEQYLSVMDSNPSLFQGDNLPVENVRRDMANEFCRRLSEKEGAVYRLPTDAEWEYVCRAGTTALYWWGKKWEGGKDAVWYAANSGDSTHPVGTKKPNPWGIYDMPGNVEELVSDHFGFHWPSIQVDPTGPVQPNKVLDCTIRGVSYNTAEMHMPIVMRPSFRFGVPSEAPNFPRNVGFRVVREVGEDELKK